MVGGHDRLPGIIDQQEHLQAYGPHGGMDRAALEVHQGEDSGAAFHLYVAVGPLLAGQHVEVMLGRAVAGHGGSRAKGD